jgi:hypothetical protein
MVTTPGGLRVSVLDLPGTYSLRARSPDEVVTRDVVLGRFAGEASPDIVVCVADATNLRLVLRLVLELKAVGQPMLLVLNMYDIAQRQGIRIDIEGLSRELGVPSSPPWRCASAGWTSCWRKWMRWWRWTSRVRLRFGMSLRRRRSASRTATPSACCAPMSSRR